MDSDVLIVGAGPTGLTLAIDLGKRGRAFCGSDLKAAGCRQLETAVVEKNFQHRAVLRRWPVRKGNGNRSGEGTAFLICNID